jgi:activating signal cointegrator 1
MKAITVTPLHAILMALEQKRNETRGFATRHRGLLAIHAGKVLPEWAVKLCYKKPFRGVLKDAGFSSPKDLPRGVFTCLVNVTDVRKTSEVRPRVAAGVYGPNELYFGDYGDGRCAWLTQFELRIEEPIRARGNLGVWECEPNISARLLSLWTKRRVA